jgi:hypothetical protein
LTGKIAHGSDNFWYLDEVRHTLVRSPDDYDVSIYDTWVDFCGDPLPYPTCTFCVNSAFFEFTCELHFLPTSGTGMFRMGADGTVFGSDYERFTVNFDLYSWDVTSGPEVITEGSPLYDRWDDGMVSFFQLDGPVTTNSWVLEGRINHGTNPFFYGDVVREVLIRMPDNPDFSLENELIRYCLGYQATISDVAYCVDGAGFEFEIELADVPAADAEIHIVADHEWSSATKEHLYFDFDGDTGDYDSDPVVSSDGSPSLNRWQAGTIQDFVMTALGPGAWRLHGRILHGSDPFQSGDTVRQTRLDTGYIDESDDTFVTTCGVGTETLSWGAVKSLYGTSESE